MNKQTLIQVGLSFKDSIEKMLTEKGFEFELSSQQQLPQHFPWMPETILYYWIQTGDVDALNKLVIEMYALRKKSTS